MDLSSALYGANAGVSNASAQIALVSRNIANQSNPNASRKIANVVTTNGLPSVASISQASSSALLTSLLSANSKQAQQSAVSSAMTQLEGTLGTSVSEHNVAVGAHRPVERMRCRLMRFLRRARSAPRPLSWQRQIWLPGSTMPAPRYKMSRAQADSGIADSVTKINDILNQFTRSTRTSLPAR